MKLTIAIIIFASLTAICSIISFNEPQKEKPQKQWTVILSYKQFDASVIPCDSVKFISSDYIEVYNDGKKQEITGFQGIKVSINN